VVLGIKLDNMFYSARIKLTAWYLLIIMFISFLFSLAIYTEANREIIRFERFQQIRIEQENEGIMLPYGPVRFRVFDPSVISQARSRVIFTLLGINGAIFIVSGFLGYFLAGRTLKPIQEIVDDQKRFIADASHELRTPLTSLQTATEVHLRNKNLTLSEAKKLLSQNLQEIQYLQVLTNDFMQLTEHEEKSTSDLFETVYLSDILSSAIQKVDFFAKSKNTQITLKKVKAELEGDKKSLTELFVIILDNAIKYSPRNSKVSVAIINQDSMRKVVIKDRGVGISDEDIPHIFNRFYRAEKSRSKDISPGYGLGLSIAEKIINRHNGSIEVESELKKGTTFTVMLPHKQSKYM